MSGRLPSLPDLPTKQSVRHFPQFRCFRQPIPIHKCAPVAEVTSMLRTRIPAFALLTVLGSVAIGEEPKGSDNSTASAASPEPGKATVDPVSMPPEATPAPSAHNWYWIRADYLGWWLTGSRLPLLVTSSPPGTPRSQAGVIGAPGTQVLFGNETVNDDFRSGVRIT